MSSLIEPSPHDSEILREILALSQRAAGGQLRLARLVGVGHSTISQWVSGARRPDVYAAIVAAKVAAGLSIPDRDRLVGLVVALLDLGPGRWVPDDEELGSRPLSDRVLELVGLTGDLAGEARSALADHRIDDQERDRLQTIVDQHRRALDELAAQLRRAA